MTVQATSPHLVLISADGHAGGNHEQYRSYLEERYLEEFDAWRARYSNPFKDLTGGTRDRNWDDARRISEQEADGVVAEVAATLGDQVSEGVALARVEARP